MSLQLFEKELKKKQKYHIPKKQRQRKKHDKHAPHTGKNCRCSRKSVFSAKTVLSFEKRAVWGGEEKNGLSGELVLLCTFYYKNMFICRKTVFLSKKQEKQRVCGACFVVVFSVLLFSVYGCVKCVILRNPFLKLGSFHT